MLDDVRFRFLREEGYFRGLADGNIVRGRIVVLVRNFWRTG
jgi:hypothetical protein